MLLNELGGNFGNAVIAIVAASTGAVKMLELNPRGARTGDDGQVRLAMTANVGARRIRNKQAHTVRHGGDTGNRLLLRKHCYYLVKCWKHDAPATLVPSLTKSCSSSSRIERLLRGLIGRRLVGPKDRINLCVEFLAHCAPHCLAVRVHLSRRILLAGPVRCKRGFRLTERACKETALLPQLSIDSPRDGTRWETRAAVD